MPTIELKPNSPEFFSDKENEQNTPVCEMLGCSEKGHHKAPKHRGLNEYYYFCLEHVKDYNRAWNFFDGMSDSEVQDQLRRDFYGDRPTWSSRDFKNMEETLFKRSAEFRDSYEEKNTQTEKERIRERDLSSVRGPETEALATLGLIPPVDLDEIKRRYKELAKKYHPDRNTGDTEAEELLKQINMAYTILKAAYNKFQVLEDMKT